MIRKNKKILSENIIALQEEIQKKKFVKLATKKAHFDLYESVF
jgi:hypothetical protein